ncbi:GNAT family N-acetyltransferase [Pleurocapsa sp. FMAR1]|uniref:GNAT family N-acetyltransferase n=1 Tax=Pleurocapsa sp. FMAR1 TaxID=3040204 RepID=UPI0029C60FA9|nr:GNAT family N-acetyltransferase [Pleurocapsa sp. FMAR1]
MDVVRFDNASEYYQRVESYLLEDEATHCLLLGISKALSKSDRDDANLPYLATVENKGLIKTTAIQTPPRKLMLAKSTDNKAVDSIAKDIASPNKSLPGVIAPKSEAIIFARTWQSLTGQAFELAVAMKIHQLEIVQPITSASGNLRLATQSDRNLLIKWGKAFEDEALGDNEPRSDHQLWFNRHLKQKSLFVWQDKVSVSMAAFGGATPNGIRINAVYTPPEYRGKGYATSCVAGVSQQLLNQDYKYCFLFTNLANPISNHIYRQIGYQPVWVIYDYDFKSRERSPRR